MTTDMGSPAPRTGRSARFCGWTLAIATRGWSTPRPRRRPRTPGHDDRSRPIGASRRRERPTAEVAPPSSGTPKESSRSPPRHSEGGPLARIDRRVVVPIFLMTGIGMEVVRSTGQAQIATRHTAATTRLPGRRLAGAVVLLLLLGTAV